MPSPTRTLTLRAARSLIDEQSFPASSGDRVGIEIEWFTTPSAAPPGVAFLKKVLADVQLPGHSTITYEPGGQVELSSAIFDSVDNASDALSLDRDVVADTLRAHGIGLSASGLDPGRPEALATTEQRYVAMKMYFDQRGGAGRRMMCTTAAVHTNVDAGRDEVGRTRWRLAHQLGPVLVAAFANSPVAGGRRTGWMSSRMAAWLEIDPTRTAPVPNGAEPHEAWASYALHANVMLIRTPDRFVPLAGAFPFARWIDEGHELGFPTQDDLAYHLTTLFPPVRPHGRLELRMMDMVADPWWRVAAAVAVALLYDEEAAARADEATRSTAELWTEAARSGLRHPELRAAAQTCFAEALPAAERLGCDRATTDTIEAYIDRFVAQGRCPGDEHLEQRIWVPEIPIAEAT